MSILESDAKYLWNKFHERPWWVMIGIHENEEGKYLLIYTSDIGAAERDVITHLNSVFTGFSQIKYQVSDLPIPADWKVLRK